MPCLSPEAVVQLWSEILDYHRRNRTGPFGLKNSDEFLRRMNLEWDDLFKSEEKKVPSHGDKMGP